MTSPAVPVPSPARFEPRRFADADGLDFTASIPFFAVHAAALAAPWVVGISWRWVALAVALYYARMLLVTITYHRYFSHRTFKTSRAFQFLLAVGAMTSTQKGVLWWAAHHRDHHRYSDTEQDIHSPKRGFWWSHVGWILARRYHQTEWARIKDFQKFPELVWLDKFHAVPTLAYVAVLYLAGGLPAIFWGYFVSTVLLWHGTFLVNSLAHVFGWRRYATTDTSKNSLLIALVTCGEGWHNNHHHYMNSANQGFFWWEIDLSFYLLKAWQALGLVWDVRGAPAGVVADTIAARRQARPARAA